MSAGPSRQNIPEIDEIWTLHNGDYVFTIKRDAFKRFRKFNLENHLFSIKVKLLPEKSNGPKLVDILDDLRQGLEQIILSLQEIYRIQEEQKHLYILFEDDDDLSFVGVTTGNYLLFPTEPPAENNKQEEKNHAKKISNEAFDLLKSILRSHNSIKLTESFSIRATIFGKATIEERKRKGTLRQHQT